MSLISTPAIARPHETVAYRPDIDGLRAIAVLAVLVFHAKLGIFPGGFVGVDVFFVISGYLIASIILKEEEKDSFSLARFYERRIRRIFPALFVVILFCAGMGALLLTPGDYLAFGRSAFAAMAFWSNFYFARQGGYFAPAAETQPLLHTWSLGVEEQFYLVAPFILLLLSRGLRRWRAPIFWSLFAASLGVSAWGVHTEARWAFFLPHSRAFELMCGVALAMGLVPRASSQRANEALAALGLALIAFAIVLYSAATPFPGFAALVPAVGAALLIHTSTSVSQTAIARALSIAPVVYVGKISYSLYLWHWPLLAFAEYEFGADLQSWHRVLLLIAAFAISALSYRYIEQPARQAGPPLTRRVVFIGGAAAIVMSAALSQIIVQGRGLPGRLSPEAAAIAAATPVRIVSRGSCGYEGAGKPLGEKCYMGKPASGEPSFVFWGDSHAAPLVPYYEQTASQLNRRGYNLGRNGCPPVFGLDAYPAHRRCLPGARAAQRALTDPNIRDVVIAARWGMYSEAVPMPGEPEATARPFDRNDAERNRKIFGELLQSTVQEMVRAGKRVTIIGPVPEFEVNVSAAAIKAAMRRQPGDVTTPRPAFAARQRGVLPVLTELEKMDGVRVVYLHEALCGPEQCRGTIGGAPLFVDDDHLSPAGVKFVVPLLDGSLTQ